MSDQAVRCIGCANFDLRTNPAMARHGFGVCGKDSRFKFHPAQQERTCERHKPAPEAITAKRVAWLASADQRHQQEGEEAP